MAKTCECGCGEEVKPGKRFLAGHNTNLKQTNISYIGHLKNTIAAAVHEERFDDASALTAMLRRAIQESTKPD
jgi:hypothetical protein